MTLGLASPTCGLMHDNSARANTQANHFPWHAHKCLTNNAVCACHGERVGGDFERTEGRRESNRLPCGPDRAHPRHTQNRREPRVVCGKQKWKRPTEKGWALNSGGEEEDRTPDLRIANAALSQLSYPPKAGHNISYGAFGNSLIVNDYFRRRTKLVFMRLF